MREDNFFGDGAAEPSPERLKKLFIDRPQARHHIMDWEMAPPAMQRCGPRRTRAKPSGTPCSAGKPTPQPARAWPCGSSAAGTSRPRTPTTDAGASRLRQGRAHGRRPDQGAGGQSADLHGPRSRTRGANLDRVQIIKGWLDAKGEAHEKVIDVAWSGDRKPDPKTGKVPSVGSTVDVKNATWTNTIGAPELTRLEGPGLRPAQRAFYYVRVIEIPTPRWTAYDAKRFGVEALAGTR